MIDQKGKVLCFYCDNEMIILKDNEKETVWGCVNHKAWIAYFDKTTGITGSRMNTDFSDALEWLETKGKQ